MPVANRHELTRQETVVLAAVGRRLTNLEIAEEFHVSVRTVESHIASLRRKLGADTRAKLISAAELRRGSTVQVPHTSFIGRNGDLEAVRQLLERHRAVTVVGSPGCGKTRLALELAAAGDRVPVVTELEHAQAARCGPTGRIGDGSWCRQLGQPRQCLRHRAAGAALPAGAGQLRSGHLGCCRDGRPTGGDRADLGGSDDLALTGGRCRRVRLRVVAALPVTTHRSWCRSVVS